MAKKEIPTFDFEQKLWQQGYNFVVGLDEVGRGPLAGPVVAAAVCFVNWDRDERRSFSLSATHANPVHDLRSGRRPSLKRPPLVFPYLQQIRDSKKLSAAKREQWYKILTNHPQIKWGIGIVSEKIIDQINILAATKLAMKRALEDLEGKYQSTACHPRAGGDPGCQKKVKMLDSRPRENEGVLYRGDDNARYADYLLLDGNFILEEISVNQKSVIRGDEKIISCAAASIIAKVTRDRLMVRYYQKYSAYGFDRHKGYGTRQHLAAIKKYGPCKIHRLTFSPLAKKHSLIFLKNAGRINKRKVIGRFLKLKSFLYLSKQKGGRDD